MKILITCQFFNYLSGSATYVYNLGSELVKRGHDVTILSEVGGDIKSAALKNGIHVVDFSNIFDLQEDKFDVIHCQQKNATELVFEFFDAPAVSTIHSELNIEEAVINPKIKQYVAVRHSIAEKYKELNPIIIPIGIDFERFNTKNKDKINLIKDTALSKGPLKNIVLFVGTIDNLRVRTIDDLIMRSTSEDFELWVVGKNFLGVSFPPEVKYFPETFFIEKYVEMCDETAGILTGTTMFEGFACGKPYRQYDVDSTGKILGQYLISVPEDQSQFDIKHVTDEYEKVYNAIK